MKVALISAFRNAEKYMNDYYRQVVSLHYALQARHDSLRCAWGEGDSTDCTLKRLKGFTNGLDAEVVDCTHGGPVYGPIVNAQRFRQLAHVGNRLWAHIPDAADVVVLVESDLIWEAATLVALIDHLENVPCVAPMIMEQSTGGFYDVWAFRRGWVNFTKCAPYHADIASAGSADERRQASLLQLDSAGSCLAMNASLARKLMWSEENVIVGICEQINQLGGGVFLDPALTVAHP